MAVRRKIWVSLLLVVSLAIYTFPYGCGWISVNNNHRLQMSVINNDSNLKSVSNEVGLVSISQSSNSESIDVTDKKQFRILLNNFTDRANRIALQHTQLMYQSDFVERYKIGSFSQEAEQLRREFTAEIQRRYPNSFESTIDQLRKSELFMDIGKYEFRLLFQADPFNAMETLATIQKIDPTSGCRVDQKQIPFEKVKTETGVNFILK